MKTRDEKLERLKTILRGYGRVAVAFSGGVDSVFLLAAAAETLGPANVLAVTAQAENFPRDEDAYASRFCRELGVQQALTPVDLLALRQFTDNPPDRCYHCKRELLKHISRAAAERGFTTLADGGNVDDLGDYRPGRQAVRKAGVVSPLAEADFAKAEIRACLKEMHIPVWNKPAAACLASRVPYGMSINDVVLRRIEASEAFLSELGFVGVRVRHHGDLARIEVGAGERTRLFDPAIAERVDARLRELGYRYIAVDLRGYRTGSLNESLPPDKVAGE